MSKPRQDSDDGRLAQLPAVHRWWEGLSAEEAGLYAYLISTASHPPPDPNTPLPQWRGDVADISRDLKMDDADVLLCLVRVAMAELCHVTISGAELHELVIELEHAGTRDEPTHWVSPHEQAE